ncbi:MAG: phosphatase PAP2 family protein [Deltaproteobacteria bacterium]|jgi:membrane-associated phospholipid phosphatase|nr:phosphatase PAP2 family protein [Deltaproteobacteria bacterium]
MKIIITGKVFSKYICVFTLSLLVVFSGKVDAAEEPSLRANTVPLKHHFKTDLAITAIASAGWIIMEVINDDIAPASCRWCGVNDLDNWGHQELKWANSSAANIASDVTAYGLAPLVAFGLDALAANHDDQLNNFKIDALIIAEAVSLSGLLNQIIKISVGRQRPYAHYGGSVSGGSPNTSFYSGHTNMAFALAVSSGTVASIRQYRFAPIVWGAGLTVASVTGYLRIAADKHYITDVLGGAVIGSAIGFAIPYLFHGPQEIQKYNIMVSPMSSEKGLAFSMSGMF